MRLIGENNKNCNTWLFSYIYLSPGPLPSNHTRRRYDDASWFGEISVFVFFVWYNPSSVVFFFFGKFFFILRKIGWYYIVLPPTYGPIFTFCILLLFGGRPNPDPVPLHRRSRRRRHRSIRPRIGGGASSWGPWVGVVR